MAHDAVSYWEAETALKRAREAADKAGVTLMVHVAGTPIPLPGILELLGPQDISTHAFNGSHENILDANSALRPEVLEAVRRGVVMDTGDAGGVLNIEICKPAFREGFFPTTISTDMHTCDPTVRTVHGVNDLVSKSFALGQPLEDAVAAATSRPAKAIHMEREIGSLAPGMEGDAAVFSEQEGQFQWTNTSKQTVEGNFRLDTYLTIRSGSVVWREGQIVRAAAE
jgi:dihydroorotase